MAKNNPISLIMDMTYGNAYDKEAFRKSLVESKNYNAKYVLEALDAGDKEELLFAITHLIHNGCDYNLSRILCDFIKNIEWI